MAGLADFIKQLQEADENDVKFSTPPEQSIKVIMPDRIEATNGNKVVDISETQPIKILTPTIKHEIEQPKKKTISFKLSSKTIEVPSIDNVSESTQSSQTKNSILQKPKEESKLKPVQSKEPIKQQSNVPINTPTMTENKQPIEQPPIKQKLATVPTAPSPTNKVSPEELAEQLFRKSGTSKTKRAEWYKYYEQAQASKKQNSVALRMKQGKFAIAMNGDVLILPDYDVRKDSDEIFKDTWL